MMKTIFEYTKSNLLVIPQALFFMKDIEVICHHKNSVLLYKNLEMDLLDVEFYTNTPCFIYIESGREVITSHNHKTLELKPGDAIFLPQGVELKSNYVKETEALSAYLIFFDDDSVVDYLSKNSQFNHYSSSNHSRDEPFLLLKDIDTHKTFSLFFESVQKNIKNPHYLNAKLQELLHLIAWKSSEGKLYSLLAKKKRVPAKRNLSHMLETLDLSHLTVSDLACLSGRSLSSFSRDFKAIYQMSPKRWLQENKLARAKSLLIEDEFSVTDIALTMGYESVSAFIKAFKAEYGVTPKQIKSCE